MKKAILTALTLLAVSTAPLAHADEKADAIISAGNTGALVAGSMKLGRLDGVEAPPF